MQTTTKDLAYKIRKYQKKIADITDWEYKVRKYEHKLRMLDGGKKDGPFQPVSIGKLGCKHNGRFMPPINGAMKSDLTRYIFVVLLDVETRKKLGDTVDLVKFFRSGLSKNLPYSIVQNGASNWFVRGVTQSSDKEYKKIVPSDSKCYDDPTHEGCQTEISKCTDGTGFVASDPRVFNTCLSLAKNEDKTKRPTRAFVMDVPNKLSPKDVLYEQGEASFSDTARLEKIASEMIAAGNKMLSLHKWPYALICAVQVKSSNFEASLVNDKPLFVTPM